MCTHVYYVLHISNLVQVEWLLLSSSVQWWSDGWVGLVTPEDEMILIAQLSRRISVLEAHKWHGIHMCDMAYTWHTHVWYVPFGCTFLMLEIQFSLSCSLCSRNTYCCCRERRGRGGGGMNTNKLYLCTHVYIYTCTYASLLTNRKFTLYKNFQSFCGYYMHIHIVYTCITHYFMYSTLPVSP